MRIIKNKKSYWEVKKFVIKKKLIVKKVMLVFLQCKKYKMSFRYKKFLGDIFGFKKFFLFYIMKY